MDLPYEFRFIKDGKMLAWLHRRPAYCDRGRYDAHVEVGWMSEADPWPRYYFNPTYGQEEIVNYLKAKKIDIECAFWKIFQTPEESQAENPL